MADDAADTTTWIEPADGTSDNTNELGMDAAAAADGGAPISLPSPTPQAPAQAPYVDDNTNVGGIPSRTKGGFGIPIPPDTRNQGGISLKASELPRSFGRACVHACVYGMSFVWFHGG